MCVPIVLASECKQKIEGIKILLAKMLFPACQYVCCKILATLCFVFIVKSNQQNI